jgi:hypothetical protein
MPLEIREAMDYIVETATQFTHDSLQQVRWNPHPNNVIEFFNNLTEMIWAAYVSKSSLLLQGLIEAVNSKNFMIYSLIARSLIEHTAILRYYLREEIGPRLKVPVERGTVTAKEIHELCEILYKHLKGGSFDWISFFTGDIKTLIQEAQTSVRKLQLPESIPKQVRVGDCISGWQKEQPEIKVLYSCLCDLVHPNMGTNLLVMKKWPDCLGFGGTNGEPLGIEVFKATILGVTPIIHEIDKQLTLLLQLKFP